MTANRREPVTAVVVCDSEGAIQSIQRDYVRVISIDGQHPSTVLRGDTLR